MYLRTALIALITFVAFVLSTIATASPTAATTLTASSSAVADGPSPHRVEPRVLSLRAPTNVRTTVDQDGFTVFATPDCSGTKTCRSWFVVPGTGVDVKDVTTTGGYFVPWPSGWQEGQTVSAGYVHSYGRDIFGFTWASREHTLLGPITRPRAVRPITARLVGQDDEPRTAHIAGSATPGASVRRDDRQVAVADGSGNWNASVADLPIGTSRLVFEQWIGDAFEDDVPVDVTFLARDLLVGVTGETVTLPGASETTVRAHLRANSDVSAPLSDGRVRFEAPTGTTFPAGLSTVRGQYRSATGGDWRDFGSDALVDGSVSTDRRTVAFTWTSTGSRWSLPRGTEVRFGVPVVNAGSSPGSGELRMTAVGTAPQGSFDTVARTPVVVERGALDPVTLSGPRAVSPGAVNEFTGTAAPGASFEVVDPSGAVIVPGGPFTVADDGTWSFRAHVPLGTLEYGFAIRQSAFGRTETSDRFTVPADTFHDVTVDPTTVSAGAVNTFSGTATPGAEYRVVNASGTEIVTGGPFSIDERGRWTFQRVVSNGATEFRFALQQSRNGSVSTSPLFTFHPQEIAPVSVTTTSVEPGVLNHFSGRGHPGATFRVLNISGTDIVPGHHVVGDDGSWAFDRVVSKGATEFRFVIQQTTSGVVTSSGLFTIRARP
ncbi:hypothetical protein DEJ03_16535 [Curtobacterium sp. MCLR17_043]|uniref:hypothetical protein n=1 Tax=Curtobacterium sp. MCLR17_043 TaxID=2175627 RepID=UPI000D8E7157|nr:hypothetical protein [Curtobacterium sp. MCLR17_043]PYY40302.1 hypothetical protein DEJ03_16535 [Curtobacterium sp. MCLR17_043]